MQELLQVQVLILLVQVLILVLVLVLIMARIGTFDDQKQKTSNNKEASLEASLGGSFHLSSFI